MPRSTIFQGCHGSFFVCLHRPLTAPTSVGCSLLVADVPLLPKLCFEGNLRPNTRLAMNLSSWLKQGPCPTWLGSGTRFPDHTRCAERLSPLGFAPICSSRITDIKLPARLAASNWSAGLAAAALGFFLGETSDRHLSVAFCSPKLLVV